MATYDQQYIDDQNYLVSDGMGGAPVSPLVQPETGIGLAPHMGADSGINLAEVSPAASPVAPVAKSPAMQQVDLRRAAIDKMGSGEKILSALGEFGAGLQGRASPLDARIKQQQADRVQKLQEFKVHTEALQDGVKMVQKLRGEARTGFIEQYAAQLDEVRPGLGTAYRELAKQPDMASVLSKYGDKSPTAKSLLEADPTGAAFLKVLASRDGLKTINAEIDSSVMPTLLKKGQTFKMGWQQLVPPEMAERFNKDGQITASELMEANDWLKANKPDVAKALAFSDEDIQIIGRNSDAFYGALGIASPKTEQTAIAEKLKTDARDKAPTTRTIKKGDQEITEEWIDGAWKQVATAPRKVAGEGGDGKVDTVTRNTELKLADDYARDTKGFKEAKTQFSAVTDYMANITKDKKAATSAGDKSLVFAYAKMNDPGDKVAVKDIQDIQKLGNVPERIVQSVVSLAKGNMLPDRIRAEMMDEITRKFKEMNTQQHATEKEYTDRAGRYKIDPRNVVQSHAVDMRDSEKPKTSAYGTADDVKEAFRTGKITRAQAVQELKQFGFE